MRLQIAGAMYIATPTPKRYAKFRYHNARLCVMLSHLTNVMDDPRTSENEGLTGEEKRLMEFINKQLETIGLN
ncbi:MAG TPA: hypothetical protein VFJ29_05175 [Candidatus Kapabacteria bacterium]|nr:hypothetical protein [Candidatus Kapabacteria bacterium]